MDTFINILESGGKLDGGKLETKKHFNILGVPITNKYNPKPDRKLPIDVQALMLLC